MVHSMFDAFISFFASTTQLQTFRPWSDSAFKYQRLSTIAFISVCDFSEKGVVVKSEYGDNHCGTPCVLLRETFNAYPKGFAGYSKSDHVHYVALTSGSNMRFRDGVLGVANVYMSFRGTYIWDLINMRRNKIISMSVTSLCEGCAVSGGALKNFIALKSSIFSILLKAEKIVKATDNGVPDIACIGMSMGASLAKFAAVYMRVEVAKNIRQVYSFGGPRVGNAKFNTFFEGSLSSFLFVQYRDPIPHVPPRMLGFRQTAKEIYHLYVDPIYYALEKKGEDPHYANYMYYTRYFDDYKFSASVAFFDVNDHQTYFIGITDEGTASCGGFADYFLKNVEGSALFLK